MVSVTLSSVCLDTVSILNVLAQQRMQEEAVDGYWFVVSCHVPLDEQALVAMMPQPQEMACRPSTAVDLWGSGFL